MAAPTQIRRSGRLGLILGSILAAVAFAAVAYASDVDVAVVDVTVPTNSVSLAPGGSAPITITMTVTGNQGGTATFEVYRNWTRSGGTWVGSSPQEFTVAPRAGGDPATVFSTSGTVSVASGEAAGTSTLAVSVFDITNTNTTGAKLAAGDPSDYVVTVTAPPPPPANTAPSVSVAGVTDGASYSKGSIPTATCQVTDAEDGNSSFAATLGAVTGTYASDGIGSQTASCSYTDGGGLTATASETYSIVDPTAPTISSVLSPAAPNGSNGWYTGNVTLTWSVGEPESPSSLQKTGCVDQDLTADQAETTYSCSATSAGGSAGPVEVTIKRDATAPTISGSASPAANGLGWNNADVTVMFACGDNLSGVGSCGPNATLSAEGAGQSVSGSALDNAGNSASTTVGGINIDKTKPSVSLVGGPTNGSSYYYGSVPAAPTCSASDALSGLNGSCSVTGYSAAVGTHTMTATAKDKAGNEETASATYTVLAWTLTGFYQPVDMGGVFNTVKNGSTVPLKFEAFVGTTELTDTAAVTSLTAAKVNCDATAPLDEVETTATGGTSLRYDSVAGQFVYNWQTPKTAGQCYRVTMKTQDASTLVAFFKLK